VRLPADTPPPGSEDAFRTLIENLSVVVFTLDKAGKFTYISPVIEQGFHLQGEQVLGTVFDSLVHPDDLPTVRKALKKALKEEQKDIPFHMLLPDGSLRPVAVSTRPRIIAGKSVGLTGILADRSGSRQAEDILHETREKYRNLVECIPAAVYTDAVDELSTTIFMSPQIEALSGYSADEWVADPLLWLRILHPEDRAAVTLENQRTNATGDPFKVEYRIIARDGHVVWVRDEATLLRDQKGQPLCWQGIFLDITDRKIAEQARQEAENDLRFREEQYRQMVELSPEAIAIHSEDRIVYANPAAVKMMGARSAADLIGRPIESFVHPDSIGLLSHEASQILKQQKYLPPTEEKLVRLDGTIIHVEVAMMPFPYQGREAFQVLLREVTERKQAAALQDSVYQIALATESTRSLNDLFPRIHEIISSVMPAENFYITLYDEKTNLLHFPYFKDAQDEPFLGEIQPGKGLTAYVLRTGKSLLCTQAVHDELERQGAIQLLGVPSAIWLGVPLIIEGKTIGAMVVQHYNDPYAYGEREQHMLEFVSTQVATAITRKQAEEALTDSETSYRGLFNSVQEAIYIQDRDGRFLDVNEGALRMYGFKREELVGMTPLDIAAPGRNDLEAVKAMVEQAYQGTPRQFEFWGRRKNGEIFPKDVHVCKGEYYGQDVVIAVAQDITERKKAEEALQRQLKELTILQAVAVAGTETVLIDDLLERVTRIIVDTFSLDSFGVMMYDARNKVLNTHPSYYGARIDGAPDAIQSGKGVTGRVAARGIPLRIGDTLKEKHYIAVTPGMRSEVCVPIKAGFELVGVLNAESRYPDHFSAADELLFMAIAGYLATAIQKLRLFESEHTRRQEAENLRQAVAVVTSSLALEEVLEDILASLRKVVAYDSASVILQRVDQDILEIVAGRSLPEGDKVIGKGFAKTQHWLQLVNTQKPLILVDAQKDPIFAAWEGSEYIRAWMAVPLIVRNKVIGYLSLDSLRLGAYTEETAVLAQNFAHTAAIAVDNARLYGSELRRRQEAETLRQTAAAVSSSLDSRQVMDTILLTLRQVLPYDSACIMLVDGDLLRIAAVQGFPDPGQVLDLVFPANDELLGQTRLSRQPFILADARSDPRFKKWAGTDQVRGWMGAPLIVRDTVIGYLTINHLQPETYDPDAAALVQAFAYQAANAIENARLYESEQRRRQEEETLREAVSIVASTLDADKSIHLILEQLERVVPYDSASVQILRDGELEVVGGRGWSKPESVMGMKFPVPGDNPNTVVVQERRSLVVVDASESFGSFEQESHQHIKSWLGIPLIAKNEVIGMLAVDSNRENFFDEESARLATLFATQVAAALENTRLYEDALQAAERRAVLHRASQEIAHAAMNPEQIYEAVHRAAGHLMPAEAFVISLLDTVNNEVQAVYLYDKSGRWEPLSTAPGVGLSGKVIESGEPVIIRDLAQEPLPESIHFGEEDEEVRSILAVPMYLGQKVIGMLSAQSYQPHVYTAEDQSLLEMLSAHAAVAIENARLYNETRQRLTELEMVNRVSTTLREAQTVAEMLPRLLEETLGALQSEAGSIWLYDSARQSLKEAAASGWFATLKDMLIPPGDGITGTVFQSGKPYVSRELASDENLRDASRRVTPAGWGGACVPIRSLQETIGVLFVAVRLPRQILPEEVRLMTTISEITGNAIRRADLYEQTQRQVQRLASLRAIDMAINTIMDLRVTLGILLDHIQTQLKVDGVDVLLLNPRAQTLYHGASIGFRTEAVNNWQMHIGEDIAGKAVRTRSTIFIQNLAGNTLSKRLLNLAGENFISYFCVPLLAKGQVKGVLEIFHRATLEPDADWRNFLETLAGQAAIAIDNSVLFEDLQRSNVDLALAYDATIEGWSRALDLRDRETEGHTQRVTELTLQLAQRMGVNDPDQVHIRRGALLHDIGKMGVPDNILNKPASLDENEWQVMHRHPVFAYEMLFPIAYLRPAIDIPYCHHERWNGKGYPRGLHGEEIPLAARLFAVVDVWDALISDRPYRKAWTRKAAATFIQQNRAILFDPAITDIFMALIKDGEE
jgi:PAS domain S-box-containing protein